MRFTAQLVFSIVLVTLQWQWCRAARDVLELQGTNLELTLTSYKYLAILFYDDSDLGRNYINNWRLAAQDLQELPKDCEISQIAGDDPNLKELIDAYGITLPSIRVFRRGIMSDYRGPLEGDGIAEFIIEDAKPSVQLISTIKEIREIVLNNLNTIVFSLFNEEDLVEDESTEGYSIDAWGQYQAAADSLRGHAAFYVVTSGEVMESMKLAEEDMPAVFMFPNEAEGILKYSGEILEQNLAEWVLRNSAPAMGELTLTSTTGELYTTQFFSSRKLKFILFLQPDSLQSGVLESWSAIAKTFKGKAIFSYITTPVADVLEYFNIDPSKDSPMIAAHQPTNDVKFKSDTLQSLEPNVLLQFVAGVMAGVVPKIVKSEPVPRVSGPPAPVVTAVGSNVLEIVSSQGKDVLLVVFAPWCTHCKKLIPTYEILGRAVQGEPRIVIAKINGAANDVPAAWGVKAYPTLLWFRAADKELLDDPTTVKPHPYWDAGYSLHELVGFVQRQGSFDVKTMRVASAEQLSSLLGDEEVLRAKYEVDERHQLRNQGREVYEPAQVDFLLGEVVFDGKRWHMLAAAALLVYAACLSVYVLSLTIFTAPKVPKKKIS